MYQRTVLGYIAFYMNDLISRCAFISLFAVKLEVQGEHIGSRLMETCISMVFEVGMSKIVSEVRKDNMKAQNFYKAFNFSYDKNCTSESFFMSHPV